MRVLGVMSGTSADGVDLVLAEFAGGPRDLAHRVLAHLEVPYPEALRQRVLRAMREATTREIALLHHDLGRFYAQAARAFQGQAELVGLSGQTVWHEPPWASFQLGEAAHLAEALKVPVVYGFRASDLAAGGQGAPLVAYPDLLLFGEEGLRQSVHNLGGISNFTFFVGKDPATLLALDTGPGVCLFDEAAQALGLTLEAATDLAEKGKVDREALSAWLAHPYFAKPPPQDHGTGGLAAGTPPPPAPGARHPPQDPPGLHRRERPYGLREVRGPRGPGPPGRGRGQEPGSGGAPGREASRLSPPQPQGAGALGLRPSGLPPRPGPGQRPGQGHGRPGHPGGDAGRAGLRPGKAKRGGIPLPFIALLPVFFGRGPHAGASQHGVV
jgi:anhydro-N-acetylmuramic acid kinase